MEPIISNIVTVFLHLLNHVEYYQLFLVDYVELIVYNIVDVFLLKGSII